MNLIKGVVSIIGFAGVVILFKKMFEPASYEELADLYEEERKKSGGDRTYIMESLDGEMLRRSNEKYEREHPNAETVHREHGRYLPNDD